MTLRSLNKKILQSSLALFSLVALFLTVAMPSLGYGLIGTYVPAAEGEHRYLWFALQVNNTLKAQTDEGLISLRWYAKCDGQTISIYFQESSSFDRQFLVEGPNLLKDIYNADGLYRKK